MIKLAAIDIGSNAVRLMLSRVWEHNGQTSFIKESLVRVPLRLGDDVFTQRRITQAKAEALAHTLLGFRHLMQAYQAEGYIACATSAMREARNGRALSRSLKKQTGLDIEIIEGKREAAIIFSGHVGHLFKKDAAVLYIDVGGGSTEVTLLSRYRIIESASFRIGTVRALKKGVPQRELNRLKAWIKAKVLPGRPTAAVGTGGTINNIFRLSRQKEGKPLTAKAITGIRDYLDSFSVDDRVTVLGLRPDRADVIVQAADLYLATMKWARVKRMYVPILGLSDGLIHRLYERIKTHQGEL